MKDRVLIYGANGFTGQLVAREVAERGLKAVLAGRNAERLAAVARAVKLPWRVVGLTDRGPLDEALADVAVVLNLAGPFRSTAAPMVNACLRTRTHYLDIGGDIDTFRQLDNRASAAIKQGVMLMPGVGFTILASDFLAGYVKDKLMPDAHQLRIAFSRVDFLSRGSIRTMVDSVREGVLIRRNGHLESVPVGQLERTFDFGEGERICTATRLADPLTGFMTTHVPNIEAYVEVGALDRILYQAGSTFALPLQLSPWRQLLAMQVSAWPEGPSPEDRQKMKQTIVIEAEDAYRNQVSVRFKASDCYEFSAASAVTVAALVQEGQILSGFQTPANVYYREPRIRRAFESVLLENVPV